jgi:hypothetical protein
MQNFEYTHKINETCSIRISGIWQKVNGEIEVMHDTVEASFGGKIWSNIPYSVIEWLNGYDKIEELAYNYVVNSCVNADQPDTTTDLQQDHYLQLNNKLD